MSDIHLDPRLGLTAGTVLGGRYAVAAVGDGGHFCADDLARPGKSVAGVAWTAERDGIDLEVARIARIAGLTHPALLPLADFGRMEATDVVFVVAEPRATEPPTPEVLCGIDPAAALRDLLDLAVRLAELDLPPLSLDPTLLRAGPAGLALPALDLAIRPAGATASVAELAEHLLRAAHPAPPLRRLLQRLRAAPGLDPARALAAVLRRGLAPALPAPPRPAVHAVELALLDRKLRDLVEAGRGGVGAVIGAAGAGKSAVLERFRWSVRRSLVTLLEVLCGDCPGPLGPLTALVRQLVGFAPPAYLWRHARDLAPFAPALAGAAASPSALVDSEARRGRLVESVLRLVREVAVARPVVLRFADLHRADPASLALLCALATELARRPEGLGCLLLLEARTGDAAADTTRAMLVALRNSDGYTEIHLSQEPPAPAAPDRDASVPTADRFEARFDRARHLAERGETEEALETLAGLEEQPLTSGLAARLHALRASVLLRRGEVSLAAAHAETARNQLLRGRKDPMLVLALIEAEQVLGAIALGQGDLERALRLETSALERSDETAAPHRRVASLTRVGNVRFARGELDLALVAYEEASGLATAHDDTLGLAEALLNRGTLRLKRRDLAAARADLERSLELRERLGDTTGAAATLSSLSLIDAAESRFAAGRDRLARARETLGRAGDIANLSLAELAAGILEAEAGSLPDSVRALRRSADLAQSRSDRRLEATARAFLSESLTRQGEAGDAAAEAAEALALARALGAREPLGLALRAVAVAAIGQGPASLTPPEEIERHLRESLLVFERASNEGEVRRTRACLEEYLGQGRPAPRGEPAGTAIAVTPGADPGLLSGDVDTDRRNLRLLAETLAAERSAGEQAALARLSEAAVARFAVLVQLTAREHGLSTVVLASHGKPPESVLEAALEAARAHFSTPTGPPGPARIAISSRATAVVVPLRLPGVGTLPSGFVLLAPRPNAAVAPFAILEALARPLRAVLQRADLSRPERRLRAHGDGFGGIVGRTPVMRKLFSLLDRVMANELPVLLQGESGTGKELVARAIHDGSPRRDRPFVPIDCAAIPESLIESELFGHARGAFTGTTSDRIGLFEEATGGTVLLDEVTNIPAPVQAKLLRVLQEREVRRVGDTQLRSIDVRVIAATNRPLEAAVREGAFREDLFFRLRVIEIVLPPLRERIEDLPLLADHFLGRLGDPAPRIERAALDRLLGYDWPGNVRELENELRRALALARGGVLREADLSRLFFENRPSALAMSEVPRLHEAVAALERELVERALRVTGYHRAKTAHLLGLSHQGLINKIRKYRIRASPRRKNDQRS